MAGLDELRRDAKELTEATGVDVALVEGPGTQVYVVLQDVPLPAAAYKVSTTTVLFTSDQQYPLSAMDMFWTDLDVVRPDGSAPQNGDLIEAYMDRQWRRFSWHRQGAWSPNRNGLLDHYEFMQARFALDVPR